MNRYLIETYGCQMNKAESDALELELTGNGWKETESPDEASVVIINTCSVRKTAEDRIIGRIGYYKKIKETNPDLKLIITGCMAERLGESLKSKTSPVDIVIGTFEKNNILDFINNNVDKDNKSDIFNFQKLHYKEGSFKAFIPIMHGCNNFCSYCIVPYVRGREISRSKREIIEEIKYLEGHNVKEITLLGQNVNSYSNNIDFPDLLNLVSEHTKSIEWIRFISSHPKDVSDKLIKTISENSKLCNHIHLPVQHGSDRILKKMDRKYDTSYYLDFVSKIKDAIPDISLTTDLLIGFPGETEEDFEKILEKPN
jgi:tRNA-2-methylthio-N6-dimethylallyladenosine synthase